jgi:hypothetical protein
MWINAPLILPISSPRGAIFGALLETHWKSFPRASMTMICNLRGL